MRKLFLLSVTAISLLLCGCSQTEKETTKEDGNTNTQNTITVSHAFGETTLSKKPKRIAAIGWSNQDTPLALGVVPVCVPAANYGKMTEKNLYPWTEEAFTKLGETNPVVYSDADGINYEVLSANEPDLIVAASSGITQEEYDLLSQIAPVVAYPTKPWQTTWREQSQLISKAMGMEEEGNAKIKEVEQLIQDKLDTYPNLKGTKTAFCWISPDDFSTFSIYLPKDSRVAYLSDLGLVLPDSVQKLSEASDEFYLNISRENTDQLNDIEMMIVYGNESLLPILQKDKLMSKIPAIKNGAVAFVDSDTYLAGACSPSILSIPYEIDDYLALLSSARDKVK